MKIRSFALLVCPLLLAACASNTPAGRDAEVRGNLTPELHTLSQRPVDIDNRQIMVIDENLRLANEDLQRFWLLDHPSRLARESIPR